MSKLVLAVVGSAACLAVTALGFRVTAWCAVAPPVSADCDMIELPGEHGDTFVKFTLTDARPVAATAVTLRLYDEGWSGEEIGEASVITLDGTIPANKTLTRTDTVKGPPGYRNGKFDSLGCTVVRVRFADGSAWP